MDDAKNTRFHPPTGLRFMTLLILVIILQYKSGDVHVWVVKDNGTLAMQSEVSKDVFWDLWCRKNAAGAGSNIVSEQ